MDDHHQKGANCFQKIDPLPPWTVFILIIGMHINTCLSAIIAHYRIRFNRGGLCVARFFKKGSQKTHIYSSQRQTAISQLDKLLIEESSCLPLWGRWPSAARSEEAEFLEYFRTTRLQRCTFASQKREPLPSPSVTPSPEGKAFEVWRSAKQQLIELFSGKISRILYLKEENTPDAPWTSGVLELFQNAAVA